MENRALVRDLVEWVGDCPKPYADVIEAWRTSCPRLTVWEDAVDAGYIKVRWDANETRIVEIADLGRSFLEAHAHA
jgi:hypothetical protein